MEITIPPRPKPTHLTVKDLKPGTIFRKVGSGGEFLYLKVNGRGWPKSILCFGNTSPVEVDFDAIHVAIGHNSFELLHATGMNYGVEVVDTLTFKVEE